MYCRNCGAEINPKARFCSNCGTKVEREEEKLPLGAGPAEPRKRGDDEQESIRKKFHINDFNWDLEGYPSVVRRKTEDINFNWDSVLEKTQRDRFSHGGSAGFKKDETEPCTGEEETYAGETCAEDGGHAPETTFGGKREIKEEDVVELSFEDEILGDFCKKEPEKPAIRSKETIEPGDGLYAFDDKKAEFQSVLDKECREIQRGGETDAGESGDPAGTAALPGGNRAEAGDQVQETAPRHEAPPELVGVSLARTPRGILVIDKGVMRKESGNKAGNAFGWEDLPSSDKKAEKASEGQAVVPDREQKVPEPAARDGAGEEKLKFSDVFSDNDDEGAERPKKKNRFLKAVALILCILVAAELVMIGIQYYAPDTAAAYKINLMYNKILERFLTDRRPEPENGFPSAPLSPAFTAAAADEPVPAGPGSPGGAFILKGEKS